MLICELKSAHIAILEDLLQIVRGNNKTNQEVQHAIACEGAEWLSVEMKHTSGPQPNSSWDWVLMSNT